MEYTPEEEVAAVKDGAVGGEGMVVCVTGAGGYIASWLVKILLSKGYTVHGTVRDPREKETMPNAFLCIVDVRDVAEALVLVYEKLEASGRYICNAYDVRACELVDTLKRMYPDYKYPKEYIDSPQERYISSKKLQSVGWSFRPLEGTLADSVESFRGHGLLE